MLEFDIIEKPKKHRKPMFRDFHPAIMKSRFTKPSLSARKTKRRNNLKIRSRRTAGRCR
jgi:hypothetical protein